MNMKKVQTILIADDDANICELVRLYLEKEGFETIVCLNGERALELSVRAELIWRYLIL